MHDVKPAAAGEIVVAVAAVHDIGGTGAVELVFAGAAIEQGAGVGFVGLDNVVAGVAIELVGCSCNARAAVDAVVAIAAVDHIGSGAAGNDVVARAPVKTVVVGR